MSALDALDAPAFEALGQQVIWSDMIGNLLGLVALALGWRRSVPSWPVQLLSGVVLVGVLPALSSGLVFSGFVHGICFVLVLLGLRAWWRQTGAGRTAGETALDGAPA